MGCSRFHFAADIKHIIMTDAIQITLLTASFLISILYPNGSKPIATNLDDLSGLQELNFFV